MRKKALITDGISYIGISFAMKVASLGLDIILIGSDAENLKEVKNEIIKKYDISVDLIVADLTDYSDINRVSNMIEKIDDIDVIVNCTGYSVAAERNSNHEKELDIVHATITAYSRLTQVVLPRMIERNRGSIIFVNPQYAFVPFTKNLIYSESKDFVNIFTKIIYNRLKETNIHIQSLNLSGVRRGTYYSRKGRHPSQSIFNMNIDEIVEYSFENLGKNSIVIPKWKNKLIMHFKKMVSNVMF